MLKFSNGGVMVEYISEIPEQFVGAERLYLDFETTSGAPDKDSINPWRNCKPCGLSITVDDCPTAYYADHKYTKDFWQNGPGFLQQAVWYCKEWINHNIKYDMHVATNGMNIGLGRHVRHICTIVRSKLKDSDRGGARGGYSLTPLVKAWCGRDIQHYEDRLQPYLQKNKDYGNIPSDVIGEYGCEDVLATRDLYKYLLEKVPERCNGVAETEIQVTYWLYRLEQIGMRYDEHGMQMAQLKALNRMCELDSELTELVGHSFRPHVNEDCFEVLCGHFGLPVIKFTTDKDGDETDNASFDKKVIAEYQTMIHAPHEVLKRISEFRKLSQRNNLFYTPILEAGWNGLLHASYNQVVRTGRMSCSDPNAQQFDESVLGLILPNYADYSIVATDASQIEKRLVLHYIQNRAAIERYQADPDTDSYELTAELCGIGRKPAKTLDLATGYGAGKKKIVSQLRSDPSIVAAVRAEVEEMNLPSQEAEIAAIEQLCTARGEQMFNAYHNANPTLKPTMKEAEQAVKSRNLGIALDNKHRYGYVTNLYGRDRHIPYAVYRTDFKTVDPFDRAWLAFSTLNQSTAADFFKERFVALMEFLEDRPVFPIGLIHDSILLVAPTEAAHDPRFKRDLCGVLESPSVSIDVPIRWSVGVSEKNCLEASTKVKDGGTAAMVQYFKDECEYFSWLN